MLGNGAGAFTFLIGLVVYLFELLWSVCDGIGRAIGALVLEFCKAGDMKAFFDGCKIPKVEVLQLVTGDANL